MSISRTLALSRARIGILVLLGGLGAFGCRTFGSAAPLPLPESTHAAISAVDLEAHVRALTDPRTRGRRAGTEGERIAADYLARVFASIGLAPAGDAGDARHRFSFTSGVALGPANALSISSPDAPSIELEIGRDWRPLAFSRSAEIPASPVVFAGYGLLVAENENRAAIDEYAGIDVQDRWVLVFRGLPQSLDSDLRQTLQRHASLRYKAMVARDHGARGILFVSGPLGRFREELVPLRFDASLAGTRIAVVSIDDEVAEKLLAETGNTLEVVQAAVDAELSNTSKNAKNTSHAQTANSSDEAENFDRAQRPGELAGGRLELGGRVDLETQRATGTNILGRLQVGDTPSRQTIVLGAHFDHLGHGEGTGSLASGSDVGGIHPGADDNASGTALLIEIAEWLVSRKRAGLDLGERDFIFAAWSGEELGLLGSHAWVEEHVNPHSDEEGPVAYLNFDMVGRLRENLVVQGLGSSPAWAELLERAAAPLALSISPQQDSYVPTDATSFYTQGIPVLNAFTGAHSEYHTPRDTLEFLNFDGTAEIGELFARIAEALSRAPNVPAYQAQRSPASGLGRTGFRVFLGTLPDYAQTEVSGVRLSGVAPAGPAEESGIRGGDIIVEVDGRTIENLYDYTYALEALRVGIAARIVVLRENQRVELEVVPGSRD